MIQKLTSSSPEGRIIETIQITWEDNKMTRSSALQKPPSCSTIWRMALALAWVGLMSGSSARSGSSADVLKMLVFSKETSIYFTKNLVYAKNAKGELLWKFNEFYSLNLKESQILEDLLIIMVNGGEPIRSYGTVLDTKTGKERFSFGEHFIGKYNSNLYFTNSFPLDDFTDLYPRPYGNINLIVYNIKTKIVQKHKYEVPNIPLECFGDNNFISYFSFINKSGEYFTWGLDTKYCYIKAKTSLKDLTINLNIRKKNI